MRYFLILFILFYNNNTMAQIEEQKYKILQTFEDVQIREYEPVIYASVTTANNSSSLFRILAGYIFGANEDNQKIAMTAPVHMQPDNLNDNQSTTMKFVMPSKYSLDQLSKPTDPRIVMEKSDVKRFAAISYSGYNNDSKFNLFSLKLREILDNNNISYINKPIYLGYDSPYKFWNRKNEVIFEIID